MPDQPAGSKVCFVLCRISENASNYAIYCIINSVQGKIYVIVLKIKIFGKICKAY